MGVLLANLGKELSATQSFEHISFRLVHVLLIITVVDYLLFIIHQIGCKVNNFLIIFNTLINEAQFEIAFNINKC